MGRNALKENENLVTLELCQNCTKNCKLKAPPKSELKCPDYEGIKTTSKKMKEKYKNIHAFVRRAAVCQ